MPEWDIPAMAACAAGMRKDWNLDDVTGALLAAQAGQWSPGRAVRELARLIGDEQATPRELRDATRDPVHGRKPVAVPPPAGFQAIKAAIAEGAEGRP